MNTLGWPSIMSGRICLLSAISECHRRLKRHAIQLSEIATVRGVKHIVEMPDLINSYRLEEYVDAELVSGEAISWCLEITITGLIILVEADVRRIHPDGQDIVETLGKYQYTTETECSAQLPTIATRLCSINPL